MPDYSKYRDAIFRSPNGAISRRIALICGRLPQMIEVAGRNGHVDLYILVVGDPVRPVYRWHERRPPQSG